MAIYDFTLTPQMRLHRARLLVDGLMDAEPHEAVRPVLICLMGEIVAALAVTEETETKRDLIYSWSDSELVGAYERTGTDPAVLSSLLAFTARGETERAKPLIYVVHRDLESLQLIASEIDQRLRSRL